MILKACQRFHRVAKGLHRIPVEQQGLFDGCEKIEIIVNHQNLGSNKDFLAHALSPCVVCCRCS